MSIIPTYYVWHLRALGRPWLVPGWIMALEYGAVATAGAIIGLRRLTRPAVPPLLNGLVAIATAPCIRKASPVIQSRIYSSKEERSMRNSEPCHDQMSSGFRGPSPCCNFLGPKRPPIVRKSPTTYGLSRSGKSKPIRYTWNVNVPRRKLSLERGTGSPRPARSPMKGKIKTVSR